MKKKQGVIVLVVTVLLITLLGFTSAVGFGPTGTGAAKNIKTGLDLSGGVSITYQTKENNPSGKDMSDTIYKLQKRVENYSEEAQVYQEGNNRINVEIPGVTDANAILEDLGKPGALEFKDSAGEVVLDGKQVSGAEGQVAQGDTGANEYVVSLELTKEGTEAFAKATEENLGQSISIVYDEEVISAPTVQSKITDGKAQITGMESIEAAEELASTIRIGSLSLELEEIRSNVVGAQLGQDAIRTSLIAGGIGLGLVIIFMIIVYALPGLVAGLALLIYTGLELVMLNAFDLTLTLPGIAGIILSIGMAVDANVIIYARIKEEIGEGKSVQNAIKTGFQKAFSAIMDGNITTLIAAAVLGLLGSGSVRGFAMTLALGIVLSMFTALVISRFIVRGFYAVGFQEEKYYGKQKERKIIDFVGKRKMLFIISLVLVLLAPIGMGIFQASSGKVLNYSLEFMGGTSTTVTFDKDYSIQELDEQVQPVVSKVTGDANVQMQKVIDSNQVIIKTRTLNRTEREEFTKAMVDEFKVKESEIAAESISSTVSGEMRRDALLAVGIATLCMLVYIWFRFKDIRFASSGVLALVHDVLVVLAFYALARISVGNTFIACMLTIVGYSINATIVIFDRIRENQQIMKKADLADIVNASITQTLTRSIYTSFTTFITIAVLFVMGVPSIREFAAPIMIGIVCGAYSSVCITGTLWYVLKSRQSKNKAVTKK